MHGPMGSFVALPYERLDLQAELHVSPQMQGLADLTLMHPAGRLDTTCRYCMQWKMPPIPSTHAALVGL